MGYAVSGCLWAWHGVWQTACAAKWHTLRLLCHKWLMLRRGAGACPARGRRRNACSSKRLGMFRGSLKFRTCIHYLHRHLLCPKNTATALKMLARCPLAALFALYPRFYVIKSTYANSEYRFLNLFSKKPFGGAANGFVFSGCFWVRQGVWRTACAAKLHTLRLLMDV